MGTILGFIAGASAWTWVVMAASTAIMAGIIVLTARDNKLRSESVGAK